MITIPIDKTNKLLKRLNDLNQEVKSIYSKYYLFTDSGMITSDYDDELSNKGKRMVVSIIEFPEFEGELIQLSSHDIYVIIRDHKKDIESLIIDDDNIYLSSADERWLIGNIYKSEKPEGSLSSVHKILSGFKPISAEDVELLVKNAIVDVSYNNVTARITKELIPSLKKTDNVMYNFMIDKTNSSLYRLYLYNEKEKIMFAIHEYPILLI